MFIKLLLFSLLLLGLSPGLFAQSLAQHQWQHRLIILTADRPDHPQLLHQLALLKAEQSGIQDRKIRVYQVLPQGYRMGLETEGTWQKSTQLYQQYARSEESFRVSLIGLDGGTKLSQTDLLTTEQLFGLIDRMPMRRAELERRKQNN